MKLSYRGFLFGHGERFLVSYTYQEYPKFLYAPGKPAVIVQDRDGEMALGEGWSPTPDAPPPPNPAASGAQDPAAERVMEESKSPWLARAAETGLEIDRRWSVMTLKTKVLEAEAAKRG